MLLRKPGNTTAMELAGVLLLRLSQLAGHGDEEKVRCGVENVTTSVSGVFVAFCWMFKGNGTGETRTGDSLKTTRLFVVVSSISFHSFRVWLWVLGDIWSIEGYMPPFGNGKLRSAVANTRENTLPTMKVANFSNGLKPSCININAGQLGSLIAPIVMG